MDPEDLEEAITDSLVHADIYVGGHIGVLDPEHEDEIRRYMKIRGLIGDRGCLTRKGVSEARKAYSAYWSDTE